MGFMKKLTKEQCNKKNIKFENQKTFIIMKTSKSRKDVALQLIDKSQ